MGLRGLPMNLFAVFTTLEKMPISLSGFTEAYLLRNLVPLMCQIFDLDESALQSEPGGMVCHLSSLSCLVLVSSLRGGELFCPSSVLFLPLTAEDPAHERFP